MGVGSIVYLCGGCLAIPLSKIVQLIPTLLYLYNRLLKGTERHKETQMKRINLFLLLLVTVLASVTLVSCEKDEETFTETDFVNSKFAYDSGWGSHDTLYIGEIFYVESDVNHVPHFTSSCAVWHPNLNNTEREFYEVDSAYVQYIDTERLLILNVHYYKPEKDTWYWEKKRFNIQNKNFLTGNGGYYRIK